MITLAGLKEENKITEKGNSSGQEISFIEILKENQECPNCQFVRLKKVDDEIFCPVCGYGHKSCG
jgi:rubredoxin